MGSFVDKMAHLLMETSLKIQDTFLTPSSIGLEQVQLMEEEWMDGWINP